MKNLVLVLGLATGANAALVGTPALRTPPVARPFLRMSADRAGPTIKVTLIAANNKNAMVSSMARPQEQQETVASAPEEAVPPPSIISRLRAPVFGATLVAVAALGIVSTKKEYTKKIEGLLGDFAASMMAFLGNEAEMASTIKSFRKKLGPGPFRVRMFTRFLLALVEQKSLGVSTVLQLKQTIGLMNLKEEEMTEALVAAAAELQKKPTMLGKLTFLVERAAPANAKVFFEIFILFWGMHFAHSHKEHEAVSTGANI